MLLLEVYEDSQLSLDLYLEASSAIISIFLLYFPDLYISCMEVSLHQCSTGMCPPRFPTQGDPRGDVSPRPLFGETWGDMTSQGGG
jgi:hypothetical protein